MKTRTLFIAFMAAMVSLVACVASESEVLKQARTIQEGVIKQKNDLDSTLNITLEDLNKKVSAMSMDSVAMKDSANIVLFSEMRSKIEALTTYRTQLSDWAINMKTVPSAEEIKKGTDNPFGKDAKDEDVLNAVKKQSEELGELKSEIETAMQ